MGFKKRVFLFGAMLSLIVLLEWIFVGVKSLLALTILFFLY